MPQRMKAGEAVIELLRQEGVTHIFGIVGSSFLDILDPLYDRDDVQFVSVRHEQGAALMADGFSRVSGTPSVCLVTNGPGVLNLTYGIGSAFVAHSPVVVLAPSASRDHQYRDSTQEFDQVALFAPITKAAFPINKIERLPDALRHAFRVATSGKMGPVLLDIPRDLLPGAELDVDLSPPDTYRSGQTRSRGDRDLVEKAARVMLSARNPVILAGGGVQWSNAADEVTGAAELLGAAIVTSYGRADAVPSDHPNFLGHLGRLGSEEGAEAIRMADAILAVGTRMGQSTSFFDHRFIQPGVPIVQIEIDPREIGRNYPVAVGIEGDAKAVMAELISQLQAAEPRPNQEWVSEIRDWSARRQARLEAEGRLSSLPIKPQRVYAELRKVIPRDAIIALDAGLAPNFGQDRLNFYQPRSLMTSLDLGGLGFSFPASLGAKFAAPGRPVINFNGDGGFLFNAQEFETAVRYGLNVVTVIMNNSCWGSEKAYQRYAFNERYVGADTVNPRFDKYAELFGGNGFFVERPEDIGDAMLEALKADGPSIIDPTRCPAPPGWPTSRPHSPDLRGQKDPRGQKDLGDKQTLGDAKVLQQPILAQEVDIEGDAIVILWNDGHRGIYPHRYLRLRCQCANCVDEMSGNPRLDPDSVPQEVRAVDQMPVGNYAVQFLWSDAHYTGLYPFRFLRSVCTCIACNQARSET